MGAYACKTAHDIGQMGAEHSPVSMNLVDDNITKVSEEPIPSRVLGQYPLMKHIRIGEDDVAAVPDFPAQALGCITVIGSCHKTNAGIFPFERVKPPEAGPGQGLW